MSIVNSQYFWTDQVLFFALAAFRVWAVVDCAIRKPAAFPAADKQTKVTWLLILIVSALFGTLSVFGSQVGPVSLITIIVASVYLADVRPAVRGISGGKSGTGW